MSKPSKDRARIAGENHHPSPIMHTMAESAQMTGVCPATIRNLIRSGAIRAIRLGRTVRIPVSELQKLARKEHHKTVKPMAGTGGVQ